MIGMLECLGAFLAYVNAVNRQLFATDVVSRDIVSRFSARANEWQHAVPTT